MRQLVVGDVEPPEPTILVAARPECGITRPQAPGRARLLPTSHDVRDVVGERPAEGEHGSGDPVLPCMATHMMPPTGLPQVVWRAGLDLNPLDVTDPADLALRHGLPVSHVDEAVRAVRAAGPPGIAQRTVRDLLRAQAEDLAERRLAPAWRQAPIRNAAPRLCRPCRR